MAATKRSNALRGGGGGSPLSSPMHRWTGPAAEGAPWPSMRSLSDGPRFGGPVIEALAAAGPRMFAGAGPRPSSRHNKHEEGGGAGAGPWGGGTRDPGGGGTRDPGKERRGALRAFGALGAVCGCWGGGGGGCGLAARVEYTWSDKPGAWTLPLVTAACAAAAISNWTNPKP
eukprot:1179384-Prorocentrum_minimum.AAC.5